MALQTFAKRVQALIEAWRVVPEGCVPGIRHQLNLRVRSHRVVLIDGGGFDNRIRSNMRNQHGLVDLRQEVVVAERAREQSLTDIRRNGGMETLYPSMRLQLGG